MIANEWTAGIHSTNTKFLVRNFECECRPGHWYSGRTRPTPKHSLSASAPGHWQPGSHCARAVPLVRASESLHVLDSPDIPQWADIFGVTLARGAQRQCNDFSPEFQ